MKIHLPEPGKPSGGRFVTGLSVFAILMTLGGIGVVIAAALLARDHPLLIATGLVEAAVGIAMFKMSRTMAETERILAANWRALDELRERRSAR